MGNPFLHLDAREIRGKAKQKVAYILSFFSPRAGRIIPICIIFMQQTVEILPYSQAKPAQAMGVFGVFSDHLTE